MRPEHPCYKHSGGLLHDLHIRPALRDANEDYCINTGDASIILRAIAGMVKLAERREILADFNMKGTVYFAAVASFQFALDTAHKIYYHVAQ